MLVLLGWGRASSANVHDGSGDVNGIKSKRQQGRTISRADWGLFRPGTTFYSDVPESEQPRLANKVGDDPNDAARRSTQVASHYFLEGVPLGFDKGTGGKRYFDLKVRNLSLNCCLLFCCVLGLDPLFFFWLQKTAYIYSQAPLTYIHQHAYARTTKERDERYNMDV